MLAGLLVLGVTVILAAGAAAQTKADSASAINAARQYLTDCRREGGRLWGRSLCGPVLLVDGTNGFSVATAKPPLGSFKPSGPLWVGKVPEGMQVANTATELAGQRWATARLPLPDYDYARRRLLIHESFHRIQPGLGLEAPDAINGHLDSRDGRFLLRLELRALVEALKAPGVAGKAALRDAVLFRERRHELFPGADTLENTLEMQEGLAEYTGSAVALGANRRDFSSVFESAEQFAASPSFVRSLGYGTGPLLGLLLDRYAPTWRSRVKTDGPAAQLRQVVDLAEPANLAERVREAAGRYGGDLIAKEEDSRTETQARALADYRARLVTGPVIILQADEMQRSFNPNNLVSLDTLGTVYPDGTFEAPWGVLRVDEGGALVPGSNREVRVPSVAGIDSESRDIRGPGWTLRLNEGWRLSAGQRPGDWFARKSP